MSVTTVPQRPGIEALTRDLNPSNFVRNIFSCVGAVVAAPLIDSIGNGWIFTILGLVSLVSGVAVILSMKKFSAKWRIDMDRRMRE